jgi:hypothetical protein
MWARPGSDLALIAPVITLVRRPTSLFLLALPGVLADRLDAASLARRPTWMIVTATLVHSPWPVPPPWVLLAYTFAMGQAPPSTRLYGRRSCRNGAARRHRLPFPSQRLLQRGARREPA